MVYTSNKDLLNLSLQPVGIAMINKILAFVLPLVWIVLIASFSTHTGETSSMVSQGFTRDIMHFISVFSSELAEQIDEDSLHRQLRIFAHFTLYFFLGIWLSNAFKTIFKDWFRLWVDTSLMGLIIAISDEFYQSMVPGRFMTMNDIFTDTLGVMVGSALFILIIHKGIKPSKKKPLSF